MNNGIDSSCIDDYLKKLDEMGKSVSKIENKALIEGGKVIHEEIVKNTPVKTGESKKHLSVSKVMKEKGRKVVKVGINKGDKSEAYKLKFYEWGTSKQIARPFMRPAFERKKNEALEKTKDVIRKELDI